MRRPPILTADVENPYGLGRVIRDPLTGAVDAIVEERDATPDQRAVTEINAGVYAFEAALLAQALSKLTTQNDQGEEYLTDVISLLVDSDRSVRGLRDRRPDRGARLQRPGRARRAARDPAGPDQRRAGCATGVTIIDPDTTWIDVDVTLGRDTVIEPNTQLRGSTDVGERAVVGPDTTLIDVQRRRWRQRDPRARGAGDDRPAGVGRPVRLPAPGHRAAERAKVGTFVEVKNSQVGAGTKIPHLSYVGDATIGEETNIGAANVVVNYDGVDKHRTVDRLARADRLRHHAGGAGHGRRRRVHRRG